MGMKDKVTVFAMFKHGFGMELETVYLEKGGCKIQLSRSDWEEINLTLQGKRKEVSSEIEEGAYYPKEMTRFNVEV